MEEEEQYIDPSKNDVYCGIQIISEIIPPNNFGKGGLYLGRVHMVEREKQIQQMKIGAILSIIDTPVEIHPKRKIKHKFIQMEDEPEKDLSKFFDEANKFISDNLLHTNVFVHCQMGISRSSTIVIAYLMKQRKQNFQTTLEYVRSKRDCVDPNAGFQEQLKKWGQKLQLK
ncbi:dual specificity phosphatase domain protein (macronuclear) [Tetrahymena thermophila SB210]|uniref:Dual specificity phosphatase domain protein n=1 Tax=Tetrahymena thermophila (strain SB210) TaxID=312017 RepID=I7M807_TETTS|nr:dual specificity phosphatase domain protein [Tetrahymena thermophila SB210]EAR96381.1 dual specificity phosphatase domain protein [Tetrahymena thermophila SB210]|eukprot:XP_001016626.1 dual specificity phosphatase domain protein [Tetrahymena thermophila SB210]